MREVTTQLSLQLPGLTWPQDSQPVVLAGLDAGQQTAVVMALARLIAKAANDSVLPAKDKEVCGE